MEIFYKRSAPMAMKGKHKQKVTKKYSNDRTSVTEGVCESGKGPVERKG